MQKKESTQRSKISLDPIEKKCKRQAKSDLIYDLISHIFVSRINCNWNLFLFEYFDNFQLIIHRKKRVKRKMWLFHGDVCQCEKHAQLFYPNNHIHPKSTFNIPSYVRHILHVQHRQRPPPSPPQIDRIYQWQMILRCQIRTEIMTIIV